MSRSIDSETPFYERPCASHGLKSYRCKGRYGWIMIGAANDAEAVSEAFRSTDAPRDLSVWDGEKYVPVEGNPFQHITARGSK